MKSWRETVGDHFRVCCGQKVRCTDSRPTRQGWRRSYVCDVCGRRIATIERQVTPGGARRVDDRPMVGVESLGPEQKAAIEGLILAFARGVFRDGGPVAKG